MNDCRKYDFFFLASLFLVFSRSFFDLPDLFLYSSSRLSFPLSFLSSRCILCAKAMRAIILCAILALCAVSSLAQRNASRPASFKFALAGSAIRAIAVRQDTIVPCNEKSGRRRKRECGKDERSVGIEGRSLREGGRFTKRGLPYETDRQTDR